jgi:hypothetical protein
VLLPGALPPLPASCCSVYSYWEPAIPWKAPFYYWASLGVTLPVLGATSWLCFPIFAGRQYRALLARGFSEQAIVLERIAGVMLGGRHGSSWGLAWGAAGDWPGRASRWPAGGRRPYRGKEEGGRTLRAGEGPTRPKRATGGRRALAGGLPLLMCLVGLVCPPLGALCRRAQPADGPAGRGNGHARGIRVG